MNENILELINISKEFPGVKALDNINLAIKKGEIHAVVGENGAGKSTIMKIISGVHPRGTYEGHIVFDGEERHFLNVRDSETAGISIIYQELALVKLMSIAENIFLGNEIKTKSGTINQNETIKRTKDCLEKVGLDVNPLTPVINLGIGQQQLVEIAKALSKKTKLLILDEPTAALTESETETLFDILRNLRQNGVASVFITHKLEEVFAIADGVTVIRDGQSISTNKIEEMTEDVIISHMVGRDITDRYPQKNHTPGGVIMEVKNWSLKNPELPGRFLLENISFQLRKGEILGIAGLMGSGRTELAMSLFGCYSGHTSGRLVINDRETNIKKPGDAIKMGLSYLSEDRKRYGLNMLMDIEDNITMASLRLIANMGVINNNRKSVSTREYIDEMHIKTPSPKQLVVNLSGGNQQKVVLSKWLMTDPKIFIVDEPTRGIDIGAKYEIYTILNTLVEKGVSIILISSELPEIIGMADRILVMHEGKLRGELTTPEITQEKIMALATGVQSDEK